MSVVSFNHQLRTGRAKRLVRNFRDNKWSPNETKSVYYGLDFCNELKAELSKPGVDGLRIYFGSYEKDHSNPKRRGKTMVIFVTTTGGNNVLANPSDPEVGEQPGENPPAFEEFDDGALCPPSEGCNQDPTNELWPNP